MRNVGGALVEGDFDKGIQTAIRPGIRVSNSLHTWEIQVLKIQFC